MEERSLKWSGNEWAQEMDWLGVGSKVGRRGYGRGEGNGGSEKVSG
jgi:hypothetical protein